MPIDFNLTDENRLVRQSVRDFVEAEIAKGPETDSGDGTD